MEAIQAVGIAGFFPIFFCAIWTFSLFLAAQMSGWARLAQRFKSDSSFLGELKGWQWGKFGLANYKRCLWIGVSAEGLYIKTGPLFFFSFFHPPLLIPWRAIKSIEEEKYWGIRAAKIRLSDVFDKTMEIRLEMKSLEGSQRFIGDKIKMLEQKK